MKITQISFLLLACFLCSGIIARAEDAFLNSLRKNILEIFEKHSQEATSSIDGEELEVKYLPRTFVVHGQSKTGEWSKEAREVVGPTSSGFLIRAVLQDSSLQGAWDRPKDARGATIAAEDSEPYWKRLIWVMPLEGRGRDAWIYLSYGSRVNEMTLGELRALFGAVR